MADVSSVSGPPESRGQMLLVAAFGVAVMLVALALILNTAIYTENIATRGSDISGGKDAARYRAATQQSVAGSMHYANYHNNSTADTQASYDPLRDQVRWGVWNFSNLSGRQQAMDSIVTNMSVVRQSEGVRIYQRTDGRMTNEAGDNNWTVVENTGGVRNFTIDADSFEGKDPNDVSPNHNSPILSANFTDTGDSEWYTVYMFEDEDDASQVWLKVVGHDGYERGCTGDYGPDGRIEMGLTAGTFNGTDCPALDVLGNMYDDDFDLLLNNTDSADTSLQYSLVINNSYGASTVQAGDGPPHKTRAVYSTTAHLVYESKRLYFETDVRVAPGEPDG